MRHGKIKAAWAGLLLLALLAGCSAKPRLYNPHDAQVLLDVNAFNGEMEAIDADMIPLLYGLDPDSVVEGACYMAVNTSVSADEVAVLVLTDEEAARAAQEAFQQRVDDQLKTCQAYAPAAVPSLEAAVIDRVGNTVLLAVGNPQTLPSAVSNLRG